MEKGIVATLFIVVVMVAGFLIYLFAWEFVRPVGGGVSVFVSVVDVSRVGSSISVVLRVSTNRLVPLLSVRVDGFDVVSWNGSGYVVSGSIRVSNCSLSTACLIGNEGKTMTILIPSNSAMHTVVVVVKGGEGEVTFRA